MASPEELDFKERYDREVKSHLERLGFVGGPADEIIQGIEGQLNRVGHPQIAISFRCDLAFRILPSMKLSDKVSELLASYFHSYEGRTTFDGTPVFRTEDSSGVNGSLE